MAEIRGTENDDVLSGVLRESNVILGLGGDDTLTGGYKADFIDGGEGDDLLVAGGVGSVLVGGAGADKLVSSSAQLSGFITSNMLDGGDGDDHIVGWFHDTLIGGAGNDTIETAYGFQGSNLIQAGSGDDLIYIDPVECTIDGGDGVDRLRTHGSLDAASIANVEILEVDGYVDASGTLLEEFSIIRSLEPGAQVGLRVSEGVDIHSQLGNTSVFLRSSTAGGQTIIVGEGDDSIQSFSGGDRIEGRGGDDTIIGSDGNSTLLGGEGADDIFIAGERFRVDAGSGDDIIRVGNVVQSAVLDGGEGYDVLVVQGGISKASLAGLEELRIERTITATAAELNSFSVISATSPEDFANIILSGSGELDLTDQLGVNRAQIIGTAKADVITSGAGDDVIDAGKGDDVVHGGLGSDRLVFSAGSDRLFGDGGDDSIELGRSASGTVDGGAGEDELVVEGDFPRPTIDISALSIADVETLTVRGAAVRATAEQLASFDSIRDARSGHDGPIKLELSAGGDLDLAAKLLAQRVNVLGTDASERTRSGAGDDTIIGSGGDDRLEGSGGNDFLLGDDRTIGNAGEDTLVGGTGKDTLKGGAGDDLYIVEDALDVIREFQFDGTDTIKTSVDYTLKAEIEILRLSGGGDLIGTGNSLANEIWGNKGANQIDGLGGADELHGGAGGDVFMFTSRLEESNVDLIVDFGKGNDLIALDRDVFAGLARGGLKESAFKDIAKGAVDGDDRLVYDGKSGELFYDADGGGKSNAVLFAELKGAPALTSEDFLII